MQVEGVPHISPPPNFIHFIKKKKQSNCLGHVPGKL